MKVADRYVYLFCGLYLILPEFLGIEFSSSLPILTAARIMVLLLVGITVVYCIKNKKFRVLSDKVVWFVVGGYFIFRLVSNLYYLSAYSDAANNIIKMINIKNLREAIGMNLKSVGNQSALEVAHVALPL